jgi:hypothetical protein
MTMSKMKKPSPKPGGEYLKARYRSFKIFLDSGMTEDEAAIGALISEADEIAQEMKEGGNHVRAKLIEVQSTLSLLAMRRRTLEVAVRRSERVGNGSEEGGGRSD